MDPDWVDVVALTGATLGLYLVSSIIDKVRGLDGSHDIADDIDPVKGDPELLEKLEKWELFWRQGCYDGSKSCRQEGGPPPECEVLEDEFSKVYRFDALEAHTNQINTMVERNRKWMDG